MEELIKRLERAIQTGIPDKDGMHPISAETMLEVVKAQLSTNLAEVGTDCISRQQAINALSTITLYKGSIPFNTAVMRIEQLPPIQPEIVRCKDCKHWKDSDGVFRRGTDAESKCPINLHQVYEGTFFCGLAERREVTT